MYSNNTPTSKTRTQSALKQAFIEIYKDCPIEKISVSAVCTAAGYSRAAFYSYYTDIYDLLVSIETDLLDELGPIFILPPHGSRLAEIRSGEVPMGCKEWVSKCWENRDFLRALLGKHGDPAFQFRLKDSMRDSLYKVAMFDGVVDDDRTKAVLEYQLSGIIGVLIYYFDNNVDFDSKEVSEIVNTIRKCWIMARQKN